MASGGPERTRRGPEPLLPAQGRGRVPVPMAPSLPIASAPESVDQHVGLRERRRKRRRDRERAKAERDARRAERDGH